MKKIIKFIVIILALVILFFLGKHFIYFNFYIPDKQSRLENLIDDYGSKRNYLNNNAEGEIEAAITPSVNWDNLFLSENFKNKFKNRNGIIDDLSSVENISTGKPSEYLGANVISITILHKKPIFGDAFDIEYIFRYMLDNNDDIDDLVLLDKITRIAGTDEIVK